MDSHKTIAQVAIDALKSTGVWTSLEGPAHVWISITGTETVVQEVLRIVVRFELTWDITLSDLPQPLTTESIGLLSRVNHLDSLSLQKVDIHPADLALVGGRHGPRKLCVVPRTPLGGATEGISALTNLESLDVTGAGVDDIGLARLCSLTRLRQFVCTDADVCDGLAFVAELPDLEEVTLRNTQASQALVESLAQSPSLRRLDLAGCPLGAAAVDSLAMFRHLEELSLSDIPLASDRIGQLFGIPRLKALSLDSCGLKDAALADLPQPSTLTSLSLLGNRLSDQCCFRLRQSYPECEILLDNPAQLRNPALVCITPAASLNDIDPFDSQGFLHLSFETEVDEACLRFGRVWGLRSLALEDVSDIGLAALRGAPTLTELVLRPNGEVARPRLTSRGLEVLQTLPRLRKLSVTLPTPVTESLRKVGAARSLEELDLGACTDLGPDSRCLTELPTLRRLSLRGATWRTQCAELAACQTLEHLHMHSTEFRFEQLRGLDPPPALRELSLNCLSFTDEDWAVLCTWREVTSITLNDITGSRVPWAKLLALPRLERVVVDKCEIDVHSDGEFPVSSALREINAAGLSLDEHEQERMLCRVAHLPCAVALSCEIKVIKIVHQLGSQREVELIERVGGVDPSRPALDYGSAVPPLSPAEETRRSIIHTWGGKVYVEAK